MLHKNATIIIIQYHGLILTTANTFPDGCSFTVCCCYFGCENVLLHCFVAVYIFILCLDAV